MKLIDLNALKYFYANLVEVLKGKADVADTNAHISDKSNPHEVTKTQVGLSKVENKSSSEIRSEITSDNVTDALGYTPLDAVGVQLNGKDLAKDSNNKINIAVDSYTKAETDAKLANKEDNILYFNTWADYEKVKNTIPADSYFVVKEDEQANPIPSHNSLMNRDANECHPIKSITGLQAELDKKTDATDTAVLKARVDQIVGEVPPGSADEIADARVMIDGKTSQNLGDAIRTQVTSLKETIDTNVADLKEELNQTAAALGEKKPNLFGGIVISELNGLTFSSDNNGHITINGKSTDYVKIPFNYASNFKDSVLSAGTYTAYFAPNRGLVSDLSKISLRCNMGENDIGTRWVNLSTPTETKNFGAITNVAVVILPDVTFTDAIFTIQIESGTSIGANRGFGYAAKDDTARAEIEANTANIFGLHKNGSMQYSIDKSSLTNGYLAGNGTVVPYDGLRTTDYIDVDNFDIFSITVADVGDRNICLYNADKKTVFFKSYKAASVTTPISVAINGAKYLRITLKPEDLNIGKYTLSRNLISGIFEHTFSAFRKFGVIGDSLSVGYIASGTYEQNVRNIPYSWGQNLARNSGNVCLNFGRSGATTETWMTYPECYGEFIKSENKCQAYIIGIGTNDSSENIGSVADIKSDYTQNANTFYGRFAKIIQVVKATAPTAKIFVFTIPHPREDESKNDAIREICSLDSIKSNVFLVDIERDYAEYFTNPMLTAEYYGDHFSASGYAMIAKIIEKALSDTMRLSSSEFLNINLIPYGSNDVVK